MRNIKKVTALALIAAMCIGSFAACGNRPSTNEQTTTKKEEQNNNWDGKTFQEAPMLTQAGTWGKVTDRLPVAGDVMIEKADYLSIGTYGGELKRSADTGNWNAGKIIEEGLFRFTAGGICEPNVAKGYKVSDDYKVYTIYLREGMKWSDGQPFTAEDCVWFFNTICLNKVDDKGVRNCHKDSEGKVATVAKVDDYTFTVTFENPKYDFIEALTVDLKWHFAPKHYFEALANLVVESKSLEGDAKTAKEAEALALAKKMMKDANLDLEFADVKKMGKELLYYFWNYPGVPTLNPYVLSTEAGKNTIKGEYYEYIRNPYYWKADAVGNQLPYIDKITYTTVSNVDQSYMLLLDGSIDFCTVGPESIATIKESNTKINIYEWATTDWGNSGTQLNLNLNFADAKKKALYNDANFRKALSICVDRATVAPLVDEWLEGGQSAPQKGQLGYSEEWAKKWTEYDVAGAKAALEAAGLVMGDDGFYNFADGTDLQVNIVSVAENGAADTYKLLEPYYIAAGIKTTFQDFDRSVIDTRLAANEIEVMLAPVTPVGDISIALKPNSMVPGYATNVAWYGTMNEETATGDLKKLIELNKELQKTSDLAKREEICLKMLKLHQDNMWTLAYVEASSCYHAVNARIKNFPADGVWSDIYRDLGLAHSQCWYIG